MESWFLTLILSVGVGSDMQSVTIQMPSKEARDEAVVATTTVKIQSGHSMPGNETRQEVSLRNCFSALIADVEHWLPGDPPVEIEHN